MSTFFFSHNAITLRAREKNILSGTLSLRSTSFFEGYNPKKKYSFESFYHLSAEHELVR
jgi:hypothetical protein